MWKFLIFSVLCVCFLAKGVQGSEDGIKIGDDCDSDSECEAVANAVCSYDDVCECKDGYVAATNSSACLRLAAKVGDPCEISPQCSSIPSGYCLNKTCVVFQATTTPIAVTKPKEECTDDSQCSSTLVKRVCKNGACVLELPLMGPKSLDFDVFLLGKPCTNDTECTAEGAACVNKLCKCKDTFVPSQNLKMCLPQAKSLGEKCTETAQCLHLNNSICESEKCTQKITQILSSFSEKIPSLLIGSTCQTDNECKHLTHALCLENICQCEDNYITSVTSNSCLEMAKKEGDPCEIDKQCENIKGATCVQKKCVKPGIIGAKLGKNNNGSTTTVSVITLALIFCIKLIV